jgi:uncharacterized protein (DUF1810 family)
MTDPDPIRFLDAQDQIYQQVVEELAEGPQGNSLDVVRLSATRRPRPKRHGAALRYT